MRGVEFEPLHRYSVGIVCAKSCPLARLSGIRPSAVPADNLVGYRATEFPEYHQWLAKGLGISKTRVVISQECDGVLSLIAAVESGHVAAVVAEFIIGNKLGHVFGFALVGTIGEDRINPAFGQAKDCAAAQAAAATGNNRDFIL
jgi:DNA-binding transcriptional LysR family regulator